MTERREPPPEPDDPATGLVRRLGFGSAVSIGLGSMIGAGVFAVFAPAAAVAGSGLLLGLIVAGAVALCNALSSAQLAAQFPTSGGSYAYGRAVLGEWPGFLAGWTFVIGKVASSAAMALTFATYLAPPGWVRPLAVVAVIALTVVNCLGVTRTATLAKVLVALSLVALAVVVTIGLGAPAPADAGPWSAPGERWTVHGVLQSAGLLFFAFAGYARIATMGEEVIAPTRTIPRAIVTALAVVLVVYLLVGIAALRALGTENLAGSAAPLAQVAAMAGPAWTVPVVQLGAAAAALGALLAMIAGIGRTGLAMARSGDLPHALAAVHPRFRVPHRAELAVGAVVCGLVLTTDLRGAIGFSSFGVLLYYIVANVAAWHQDRAHRRYPRAINLAGGAGCLLLCGFLPLSSIATGLGVVVAGLGYRWIVLRLRRAR